MDAMESVAALLEQCRRCGVALAPGVGGKLRVSPPPEQLPEALRRALTQHKADVLAAMARCPRPYLTSRGELIVPHDADPKYYWWNGGQTIQETLEELGASPEVVAKYVETDLTIKQ